MELKEHKGDKNRPIAKSLDGMCAMWLGKDKNGNEYMSLKVGNIGNILLYKTDKDGHTPYFQEKE